MAVARSSADGDSGARVVVGGGGGAVVRDARVGAGAGLDDRVVGVGAAEAVPEAPGTGLFVAVDDGADADEPAGGWLSAGVGSAAGDPSSCATWPAGPPYWTQSRPASIPATTKATTAASARAGDRRGRRAEVAGGWTGWVSDVGRSG